MESNQQFEFIRIGKLEESSLQLPMDCTSTDDLLFDDNYANELFINEYWAMEELRKADHKKHVEELLIALNKDFLVINSDYQSSINHDGINTQLFDYDSSSMNTTSNNYIDSDHFLKNENSINISNNQNTHNSINNGSNSIKTEVLLKEFNNIYDSIEMTHLTPPHTPPIMHQTNIQEFQDQSPRLYATSSHIEHFPQHQQQQTPVQYFYDNINYNQKEMPLKDTQEYIYSDIGSEPSSSPTLTDEELSVIIENNNLPMANSNETSNITNVNIEDILSFQPHARDIARELEVVDELVRSHDLQEKSICNISLNDWNTDDDSSTVFSTSNSSVSSFSPRSEGSLSIYSQDDDEENNNQQVRKCKTGLQGVSKKRTRPYVRGTEDKKSRKKEQNKNAATRYRQKKKQEIEIVVTEEQALLNRNNDLNESFDDVKREVKYLKKLLRDLFKARGFI